MSAPGHPFSAPGPELSDQPVDVQRYAAALRRSARLIAAAVITVTVAVVVVSRELPKSYQASAGVVFNPTATLLQPTDATSIQRQLATLQAFVTSPSVIAHAARALSEPRTTIKNATQSSTDPNANIITITASAGHAEQAAARANAVAVAFVAVEQRTQTAGLRAALAQLQSEIDQLRGTPNSTTQISALEDRVGALQISIAGSSSVLQVGNPATVPFGAATPKPSVNGIVALVASLVLSILFVLARDQRRPRFFSAREVGRFLGTPVLGGVPYRRNRIAHRRRRTMGSSEQGAYDALLPALGFHGLPGPQRMLLVSSATHGEGRTTVTAGLGRSLARAGHRVLLISADARTPALHKRVGLSRAAGLVECLEVAATEPSQVSATIDGCIRAVPGELGLDLLDAGETGTRRTAPVARGSALPGQALEITLDAIRRRDYSCILIDSAPLLDLGDTQYLARYADDLVLVARLGELTYEAAADASELTKRLKLSLLGVVVIGARVLPHFADESAAPSIAEAPRAARAPSR